MKILLTGQAGQLATELRPCLAELGEVLAVDRRSFDLADEAQMRDYIRRNNPQVIVNAAAYTAVDKAESEHEVAHQVNAVAPGVMAEEAARAGALLVHYSTDYVFDGAKCAPYVETDVTAPLNLYGKTKAEGEERVRAAGARYLILRTSWVYGAHGHNFFMTMERLSRERQELRVVNDQHGAPTWSRTVARASCSAVERMLRAPDGGAHLAGTYHLTAHGETTWCSFAQAIMQELGRETVVKAIRSEEYPTPAKRPRYSLLDSSKLERAFGVSLPQWREPLAAVVQEMRAGEAVG